MAIRLYDKYGNSSIVNATVVEKADIRPDDIHISTLVDTNGCWEVYEIGGKICCCFFEDEDYL